MTVIDQNPIHEETKIRLNSDNASCHSVQNLLLPRLLSKNMKIKIYKTTVPPAVLYGRETWFLILREKHRLRVFENRVLTIVFGPKRDETTGCGRKVHELHNLHFSSNTEGCEKI
jgi:hypothetical protein